MQLSLYQIDAFASKPFEGNPAAVCPLEEWLPDRIMQSIAQENNLSETAFYVPSGRRFHIRWFTPTREVDLCGHATLASAHVLFNTLAKDTDTLEFDSRSGILTVRKKDAWLVLDFPAQPPVLCPVPEPIIRAFKPTPTECLKSKDYLVVFEREGDVVSANPHLELLQGLDLRGVIITSRSAQYDFIARFFAPKYGVPEDPVTGSAYTQLAPYWAPKIGRKRLQVKQVSSRGGELSCELVDDRVHIFGKAVSYLEGTISIDL